MTTQINNSIHFNQAATLCYAQGAGWNGYAPASDFVPGAGPIVSPPRGLPPRRE